MLKTSRYTVSHKSEGLKNFRLKTILFIPLHPYAQWVAARQSRILKNRALTRCTESAGTRQLINKTIYFMP
jgi:hypothetical protein